MALEYDATAEFPKGDREMVIITRLKRRMVPLATALVVALGGALGIAALTPGTASAADGEAVMEVGVCGFAADGISNGAGKVDASGSLVCSGPIENLEGIIVVDGFTYKMGLRQVGSFTAIFLKYNMGDPYVPFVHAVTYCVSIQASGGGGGGCVSESVLN